MIENFKLVEHVAEKADSLEISMKDLGEDAFKRPTMDDGLERPGPIFEDIEGQENAEPWEGRLERWDENSDGPGPIGGDKEWGHFSSSVKEGDADVDSKEMCTDEEDMSDYNEDGTRELTEEEKKFLNEKLGWSDEQIKKCTIDENGVIHYKTDRCDLEGETSKNGVPYERKTIEINGVKIEGVFPVFDSAFDTELSPDKWDSKAYAKECNEKLREEIKNNPELKSQFSPEQIKEIEDGKTPNGYVWHHNEEPGKMQLVKREDHDKTIGGAAHTGGSALWGPDSHNSKKGEKF